jgi:hypothetical protein
MPAAIGFQANLLEGQGDYAGANPEDAEGDPPNQARILRTSGPAKGVCWNNLFVHIHSSKRGISKSELTFPRLRKTTSFQDLKNIYSLI